jgi:gliding motility-associated-like protein
MRFFVRVLAIAALYFLSYSAQANHVLGGNLTWDCLGGNQYTITMRIYKDCFGASPALSAENLFVFPTGCVLNPQNITLNLISTTEISNLCASELPSSSCLGGLSPGTQMLTYQATVTLAPGCTWEVIWNEGDWNYFNNINYSTLPDAYLDALINTNYCADSPVITSMQVPYVCRNNGIFVHTPTVTLPAGVNASYTLSTPQTTGATLDAGINVPGYVNTLGATVNPTTGAVSINTNAVAVGNYIVTVQITLTQGGNNVGVYYENMVFVIRDCAITPTTFATPEIQSINIPANQAGPATINACSGDSVCFTVSASNTNLYRAITITSTWSTGLNVGTPVFTQSTVNYNPASATFCFTAQPAMVGVAHTINFHAEDNACTAPQSDDQVVTVNVFPSVILNPTTATICNNASVTVTASGGTTYTWSVLSGDATPGFDGNVAVQVLESISSNTVIMVSMPGVPAQCNATDTLTVTVPDFTLQPLTTQSLCVGGTVTPLTFTLLGVTGTPTYQWYSNATNANTGGSAIVGATSAAYTPSSVTAGTAYYYCLVTLSSASCPNITTNPAEVIVVADPTIDTQPLATQTICLGGTGTLSVVYSNGLGNATYQWYSNTTNSNTGGSIIAGATNATYTTPVLTTAATRNYYCIVTLSGSGCGTAVSAVGQVVVVADPTISTQPTTTQSICVSGTPASISVAYINGSGTPTYQWYSNTTTSTITGTAIPGATSATFTFSPMNTPGTYYYYCVITLSGSGCNVITSATSQVIVVADATIATQPQGSQTVCLNGVPNALTVTINNGLGTITYQWYCTTANNNFTGSALPGATSATFVPPTNVVGARYYYCRVNVFSLTCGVVFVVTSAPGAIIVVAPPTVNAQPTATQSICIGGTSTPLSMGYTGGTGTASYQWYSNLTNSNTGGTAIAGATTNSYTPAGASIGTFYYYGVVTLTGLGCGSVSSNVANVNVIADPIITTQPTVSQTMCVGGIPSALNTAYSGGAGTASYQWFSNTTNATTGGTAVSGATGASFTPAAINAAGNYFYYGAVTLSGSGCGTVTSSAANVIVVDDPSFSAQPLGTQTVCLGGTTTLLSTTAIGGTGILSYQWFSNASNSAAGGTLIAGATTTTYSPPSGTIGTIYYYCEVSATGNGCGTAASATAAVIVVSPPTVSTQPTVTQTICNGGTSAALTVAYTGGTGTASYQWYSNATSSNTGGTLIAGATTSTYTPTGLTTGTYYYYCVITLSGSSCGSTTSNIATVIAVADPTITTQPTATQTICVGGAPSALTLAYSNGTGTPSYQWYSNTTSATTGGTLIAGATSASYAPPVLNIAGSFYYYGIATLSGSGCGTATSASAVAVVIADPTITTQPQLTQTVCPGGTPTALAIVSNGGTGTTSYQWFSNTTNSIVGGTLIAGATNASYTPTAVAVGTIYYYGVATLSGSGCGAATSSTGAIVVVALPTVSTQPTLTQTICDGGTATALNVAYTGGTGTPSYQWYSNATNSTSGGTSIAGATASTYTPTGLAAGTSYYYCIITLSGSACGTATSNTATVIAVADPTITTQPTATQTICVGGTPSALTLAYSNGTGTPSYQWYSNTTTATTGGTLVAGATAASYTPPVLNTAGSFYYYGIATLSGSGCGTATSASAVVVVIADPTITTQPILTQTVCPGGAPTALTIVSSGGTGTTSYQWFSSTTNSTAGGTLIAGATSASYTPTTAAVGTTYYYGVATLSGSGCGTATSATGAIVVSQPTVSAQPTVTQTICDGGTASALTVAYTGGIGTASYQWYSNTISSTTGGTLIAGATTSTYTPTGLAAGTYYFYCEITLSGSACGTITSNVAAVIAVADPTISTQPTATQSICVGGTPASLTLAYTNGIGIATYQWYSNTTNATTGGTLIAGATNSTYNPAAINAAGNFYYYATVSLTGSGCGTATTVSSEVVVVADPTISVQPLTTQTNCQNGISTPLTVTIAGGTGTTTYQWYTTLVNSTVGGVASGNGATLTPLTVLVGTAYVYCVVNTTGAGCSSATSATAEVIVLPIPSITAQPLDTQTVCQNGTTSPLTFTVANASGTTTYQWYSNSANSTTGGTAIAGATAVSFNPGATTVGTTYFYCVSTVSLGGSGCGTVTTVPAAVIVVGLPSIATQPTATQNICVGGTPSQLSMTYAGGTGTASYQWYSNTSNTTTGGAAFVGATSASFTPPTLNTSGSYFYYGTVTLNGAGCGTATTASSEVLVSPDPTIATEPLFTQSLCVNGAPSNLQVTYNNGAGTASYQWYSNAINSNSGGTQIATETNSSFTPSTVSSGTQYYYCVIILSGVGCGAATSAVSQVVVVAAPTVSIQPNPNETVCLGGTPTTLSPAVVGGTGTASYQWYSNSANSNTGGTAIAGATNITYAPAATAVGSTYYYLSTTFAGTSCGTATTNTSQIIVLADPTISTQPLTTESMCVGGTPSALTVVFTGGVGTPTYQWYSNATNSNVGGTVIAGAGLSTYNPASTSTVGSQFFYAQITLSGSGCDVLSSSVSEIVNVADPIISTQPIAAQDVCLNSPSTAINAAVSGGLGTVSYAWYSNSTQTIPGTILPGANTNTVTPANTPAGISYYYMVATLSGNGCNTATSNFSEVTVHALPTVTAAPVDNSICFGTTTDIVAGGASSYLWTADLTITSPVNVATVTVAPIGSVTYTVQGTDTFGCVNTATATVVAATQLNVQENITTNICYQTCTGAIALTPSGSGATYAVAWNTAGVTGLNPQNLCPGNYTYTVTDNLSCTFQNTVNIASLPNNPLDNVIITQPTCFGYNNGSIQFQDASAVSFQLVNAATNAIIATQPSGLFGTIGAGNYNIIYNDALGCVYDSLNFSVVAQSAQITLTLNAQAPVLCFNQVVPLTAIAGGGDGGAITVTWGSCNTVTNCILGTGNPYNYTLISDVTVYAQATDASGCASAIQSIALNLANPIQVNLQNGITDVTICEGDCVNMSAVATGGNNPIIIEWYEVPTALGGATIGPDGTNNTICPTTSTSVFVFADDGCGVPDYDTLNIIVQSFPTVSFSVNTQDGCLPLTVSFTNNTTPTFNGNCLWNMDDGGTTFANCGNQVFTYTEEGTYSPTLYVISPEGCSTTYSLPAPIVVHGYPVADFSWAPQPVDVTNPVVQFTDASVDAVNYLWEFAWLGASDLQNPVFIFPDEDLAEYPVCLTVENSFGCADTMCRTVRLNSVLQVWVPNAFTPEQDGLNEVFLPVIKGGKPETYHFTIFDRWGTLIFESFEMGEPWIGDVRNGNAFAKNDTYVWRLEVKPLTDRSLKVYTGFVTVIR